jgi:hypothetical protein
MSGGVSSGDIRREDSDPAPAAWAEFRDDEKNALG